jgi:ribonuclease HII
VLNRRDFDRQFPGPVLGIDEVGVGAIAGPLTACGLVLPGDRAVEEALMSAGAKDSKKLSEPRREALSELIKEHYIWYFVVWIEAQEYRKGRMMVHLNSLFRKILLEAKLRGPSFDTIIIDGDQDRDLEGHHFKAIPKGDDKSLTVACASIMAKTHRDSVMRTLGRRYPGYGFSSHKGYPTSQHKAAITEHGAMPGIHRSCKALDKIISSRPQHPGGASVSDWDEKQRQKASAGVASLRPLRGSGRFR